MKKLLLLPIFAAALVLNSCKKDADAPVVNTVSTEHKTFLIDFTSTQCCPCGANGLPAFKSGFASYPNKLCGMSLHCDLTPGGDTLKCEPEFDQLFFTVYNQSGVPTFAVNNNIYYPDASKLASDIEATLAQPAVCGVGIAKSISGSTMSITTKTHFFKAASGNYNIAIYITEDGLHQYQACSSETTHDHVCRGSANGYVGSSLTSGSVAAGQEFDKTFTWTIPSKCNSANLHVVAVIYDMSSGKPKAVVNCNSI